jgi:hypothetical protein
MHQFQGFPDLRLNSRTQASGTMLWPSFTDIMTMILMVFMLTMVAVILKNAYLADLVRLSQGRLAVSERKLDETLALNIDLEDKLRAKEMEIILLGDELGQLSGSLQAKVAIIDQLSEREKELLENIRLLQLDAERAKDRLEASELRLSELTAESEARAADLSRQIADLLSRLQEKEAVLLTLSDQKSDLELALARQRQDFSSLEDKYLRLVRPARSALGKMVATVRYSRIGGAYRIMFAGVEGGEPRGVSREELHRRLSALKERYGKDLYVKIVIPDDSGLSYNEAWDFTKEILSRYDYYYVDGWVPPADQD